MCSDMPSKICNLYKLFVTKFASKWFFACVKPDMCLKVMISGEFFSTYRAFEWLFACVGSFMVLKDVLVAKTFVASLTGELTSCSSGASAAAGISGRHLIASSC